MSTAEYSESPPGTSPLPRLQSPPIVAALQRSSQRPSRETLAGLIEAAGAALDHDRDTARACIARAAALLQEASRERPLEASRGGLAPWQARRVESYVAAHLGGRIRTTDLAAVAQLSASHFTRAFKETFGETPIGYVSRQRMRYAQDLMLKSGECLSQIALTCGHCDQSHFTRVFRRKVGMSPRAWRRQFAPAGGSLAGHSVAGVAQPCLRSSESTLPNR